MSRETYHAHRKLLVPRLENGGETKACGLLVVYDYSFDGRDLDDEKRRKSVVKKN
jgi:hypothetical protein